MGSATALSKIGFCVPDASVPSRVLGLGHNAKTLLSEHVSFAGVAWVAAACVLDFSLRANLVSRCRRRLK